MSFGRLGAMGRGFARLGLVIKRPAVSTPVGNVPTYYILGF